MLLDREGPPNRLGVQALAFFSIVHQRVLSALFGGCEPAKIGKLTHRSYLYNTRIGIIINRTISTSPSYHFKLFSQLALQGARVVDSIDMLWCQTLFKVSKCGSNKVGIH